MQGLTTNYEADPVIALRHDRRMLSHDELLEVLRGMKENGATTNAELSRILKIPTSRVADIFTTERTPRKITVDEMKVLVEHFRLNEIPPVAAEVVGLIERMGTQEQARALRVLRSFADDGDEAARA